MKLDDGDVGIFWQIVVSVGGWIAVFATLRAKVADHERRIQDLEECERALPANYVPRREISAQLHGIRNDVQRIVDHFVYPSSRPRWEENHHASLTER